MDAIETALNLPKAQAYKQIQTWIKAHQKNITVIHLVPYIQSEQNNIIERHLVTVKLHTKLKAPYTRNDWITKQQELINIRDQLKQKLYEIQTDKFCTAITKTEFMQIGERLETTMQITQQEDYNDK